MVKMNNRTTLQWDLVHRLKGPMVIADTFKLKTTELPELTGRKVLVQIVLLSNDPAMRTWITGLVDQDKLYTAVKENEVMQCRCVAKIVECGPDAVMFKPGDYVYGALGWTERGVFEESILEKIPEECDIEDFLALGMTAFTAYFGLLYKGSVRNGDTVVVSAAAGAVGNVVCQVYFGFYLFSLPKLKVQMRLQS
jgi:NADPH-dependent curcumin reductase CurA